MATDMTQDTGFTKTGYLALEEFDAVEVHRVIWWIDQNTGERICETDDFHETEEVNNRGGVIWSVYLHRKDEKAREEFGPLICIADCETEGIAETIAGLIRYHQKVCLKEW